jgi:hypothetical protein
MLCDLCAGDCRRLAGSAERKGDHFERKGAVVQIFGAGNSDDGQPDGEQNTKAGDVRNSSAAGGAKAPHGEESDECIRIASYHTYFARFLLTLSDGPANH